jgi:hypothetical protein
MTIPDTPHSQLPNVKDDIRGAEKEKEEEKERRKKERRKKTKKKTNQLQDFLNILQ